LTTKLIVHLAQPAMAVARVWKSPVPVALAISYLGPSSHVPRPAFGPGE